MGERVIFFFHFCQKLMQKFSSQDMVLDNEGSRTEMIGALGKMAEEECRLEVSTRYLMSALCFTGCWQNQHITVTQQRACIQRWWWRKAACNLDRDHFMVLLLPPFTLLTCMGPGHWELTSPTPGTSLVPSSQVPCSPVCWEAPSILPCGLLLLFLLPF